MFPRTRRRSRACLALAIASALLLAGCGDDDAETGRWVEVDAASLTPPQEAKRQRAVDARDRAATLLVRRLTEVLDGDGPGAAIAVCRDEAPGIAARVAAEKGVSLGRTSFHLRNPANAPPEWARPYVEERRSEPVYLAGPKGALAALLPIQTMMPCLTCHGLQADLAPEVKRGLDRLYPRDQATGFRLGDLRGWFWVQVP